MYDDVIKSLIDDVINQPDLIIASSAQHVGMNGSITLATSPLKIMNIVLF